jgi:hypothetical protein
VSGPAVLSSCSTLASSPSRQTLIWRNGIEQEKEKEKEKKEESKPVNIMHKCGRNLLVNIIHMYTYDVIYNKVHPSFLRFTYPGATAIIGVAQCISRLSGREVQLHCGVLIANGSVLIRLPATTLDDIHQLVLGGGVIDVSLEPSCTRGVFLQLEFIPILATHHGLTERVPHFDFQLLAGSVGGINK